MKTTLRLRLMCLDTSASWACLVVLGSAERAVLGQPSPSKICCTKKFAKHKSKMIVGGGDFPAAASAKLNSRLVARAIERVKQLQPIKYFHFSTASSTTTNTRLRYSHISIFRPDRTINCVAALCAFFSTGRRSLQWPEQRIPETLRLVLHSRNPYA